jgi:hypothetical protein
MDAVTLPNVAHAYLLHNQAQLRRALGSTKPAADSGARPGSRTRGAVLAGLGALTAATLAGVVGVNALREQRRTCWCEEDCWCKTSVGRHLRWWVPARHHKLRGVEPEATI